MMELNDKLDYDVSCDSARYPRRASECTGVIPAGQAHYRRDGSSLNVNPDDWNDLRNRPRICVHCVRWLNWECGKDALILVRAEFTYSDGTRRVIDGEAADDWQADVGSAAMMLWVHGDKMPEQPGRMEPAPKWSRVLPKVPGYYWAVWGIGGTGRYSLPTIVEVYTAENKLHVEGVANCNIDIAAFSGRDVWWWSQAIERPPGPVIMP